MPSTQESKQSKSIKRQYYATDSVNTEFDLHNASIAIAKGLQYLKDQLGWSGTKIADILHIPPNTVNTWLKLGKVPIGNHQLSPEAQAIIHLLAIHRCLEAMFDQPSHQSAWLSTWHPTLDLVPENLMHEGLEGLIYIRQYLDYVRGRGA